MSSWLEHLDQWAFSVLVVLSQWLGVQDLPQAPSNDWKVIDRWVEQPNQIYRLTLESTTVPDYCRANPKHFVVFPAVYVGQQEIYLDNVLVYTNSMSKKWNLASVLNRSVLSCELFTIAKRVSFKSEAYLFYFASINVWPIYKASLPIEQIFYNTSYLIVGVISLAITLMGSVVLILMGDKKFYPILLGLSLSGIMMVHVAGYFMEMDIKNQHFLLLIFTIFFATSVIYEKLFADSKIKYFIFLLNVFCLMVIYRYKHLIQLYMLGYSILFTMLLPVFISKIEKQRLMEKITYSLMFIFCLIDIYRSQAVRDGFLNLTFLFCASLLIFFIIVIRKAKLKMVEIEESKRNFLSERKLVNRTSEMNLKLKQIIHDLKSPITSLNFILRDENINKDVLLNINQRLNEVLNFTNKGNSNFSADWYSLLLFEKSISDVILEKNM